MVNKIFSPGCAVILGLFMTIPVEAQPTLLKPLNAGKTVNTEHDEIDPFLLPDGLRMVYASNANGDFDLMVAARKAITQPFTNLASLKPFNTKDADERTPFFFAPLKEFYFCSNRVPDDQFKDLKNLDVYVRTGDAAPFPIQGVNTPVEELAPWITPTGEEFFFSRKTKEGWRVCVTNGPKFGAPDKGKIIEEIPPGYHHATLLPNGLTMFLQGPLDKDRTGLFRTTRKKVGDAWEKPKALINLNHPEAKRGDMTPALSLTGATLFFSSDRPGGQGGLDIWMVAVNELKTE